MENPNQPHRLKSRTRAPRPPKLRVRSLKEVPLYLGHFPRRRCAKDIGPIRQILGRRCGKPTIHRPRQLSRLFFKTFPLFGAIHCGIHSRLVKISSLELDNKLKGHPLLRQAHLHSQEENMMFCAASGSYEVRNLTSALRNAYINSSPSPDPSLSTQPNPPRSSPYQRTSTDNRRNDSPIPKSNMDPSQPTFYTYKTSSSSIGITGSVLDSGACT